MFKSKREKDLEKEVASRSEASAVVDEMDACNTKCPPELRAVLPWVEAWANRLRKI